MYPTDNWVEFTLNLPMDKSKVSGKDWDYFTAGVVILGDVLDKSVPGGLEIYFEDKDGAAEKIWDAIFEAGKAAGIKPIGLGARDTLRLEMGFCLYGNDIDDTTSPLEAGLGWITKFTKDFTSRKLLEQQKANGVNKKLVGFEMVDKGIARHGYEIKNAKGETIGRVTSGTQSPSLGKAIGMGYVKTPFATPETTVYISIRNSLAKAKLVKMPFSA